MSDTPRFPGPHSGERLQDLLDGRLPVEEAAAVRTHLNECLTCQREWQRLQIARDAAALLRSTKALPAGFEDTLRSRLDAVDAEFATQHRAVWRGGRRLWFATAAAAAATVVFAIWRARGGDDLVAEVMRNHAAVLSGTTPLDVQTNSASALEAYFEARGLAEIRVIDLAMSGYTLEGGRHAAVADRPAALYLYRAAAGERLVCQMYRGRLDRLPAADAVHARGTFVFHVFTRGRTTAVFWQEGEVVCVLSGDVLPQHVLALAVEKAMT